MAIIVKEEKKTQNIFPAFLTFLILLLVGVTGYALFFAPVPLVEKVAPTNIDSLSKLAELKAEPDEVMAHPTFKKLREYVGRPSVGVNGRSNPFLPL